MGFRDFSFVLILKSVQDTFKVRTHGGNIFWLGRVHSVIRKSKSTSFKHRLACPHNWVCEVVCREVTEAFNLAQQFLKSLISGVKSFNFS